VRSPRIQDKLSRIRDILKLLSRREREIFDIINSNLFISIEAVKHVISMLQSLHNKDWKVVSEEYFRIDEIETRADRAHRDAVVKIVQGAFYGGIREDILNILEKVDSIADSAKDAAKIMIQRRFSDASIERLFHSGDMMDFASRCLDAVYAFQQTVQGLTISRDEALKYAQMTELYEEEADTIKQRVLEHLLEDALRIDTLDLIMIRDFVNILDNVADNAEDGTDIVVVLLAKGYS